MSSFWHHSRHNRVAPGTILGTQTGNNFWHTKPVVTIGTTIREWFSAQYLVQQAGSNSRHNRAEVCCTFRSHLGSSLPPGDCAMQHDMVSLTCPACQSSISVQLPLQLHDEQQQQQRRLQLLESQKALLESMKILDQGRDVDRQGELAKAFELYKVGLAMAIQNLRLWPVINPMMPLIDECRSKVFWTMNRSEKISAAFAAWAAVTEHPMPMMIQAFKVAAQSSASSSSQHGVASGTEQREPAHPMPEMRQHQQVAQQQAQQPQPVAKQHAHPDAREPLQQQWKQVGRVRVEGEKKEQQQQQQQLQGHHQQQPQHQQLEDRRFGPRQPWNPPPDRLLQVVKPTALSKAIGVVSEVAHKKQRVEMREEVEEERKEREVNPWDFLQQEIGPS